jgi:hypothetical protein
MQCYKRMHNRYGQCADKTSSAQLYEMRRAIDEDAQRDEQMCKRIQWIEC